MPRLEVFDPTGGPTLETLPATPAAAACELVACAARAGCCAGAGLSYPELLCASGAAFMLRVSPAGFHHDDAAAGRGRFLPWALAEGGLGRAGLVDDSDQLLPAARAELTAGRPLVAMGCFPEAPWRAGLVVGMPREPMWAVLDCAGRVHSLAARASLAVAVGCPGSASRPPQEDVFRRCLWCWEGMDEDEGPGGWRNWLRLLAAKPPGDADLLLSQVSAHEFLYETLLDGRTHAANWLADRALEAEGFVADWLYEASDALGQMMALLERREPHVGQPDVPARFAEPEWRRYLAELLADAAELDLRACKSLARALDADYPPMPQ